MRKKLWIIVLAAIAMLAGCQRRPLEVIYRSTVRVVVQVLWQVNAYPEGLRPSGVTMYFFRDGEFYTTVTTANVDSCEVQLPEGHYNMYMITQSPDEYWKMEFDHMTSYTDASTTLRSTTINWDTRSGDDEVVQNPEILCAGVAKEFDITLKETEEYQYYYTNLKRLKSAAAAAAAASTKAETDKDIDYYQEKVYSYTIRIPVHPKNIVSQLWVTIYSDNADMLRSVRASTSGMARTFELTQNTTGSAEAVQIISDEWALTMDDETTKVGHIDAMITTFGLPNGEHPSAMRDSTLNVSALLIDNKTVENYVFNTGDKIQLLPANPGYRGMYRLIFGSVAEPAIHPPIVDPEGGKKSGMEATVSDWEDGETVEIPM